MVGNINHAHYNVIIMAQWPYSLKAWERLSKAKLQHNPLCELSPPSSVMPESRKRLIESPASFSTHRLVAKRGPLSDREALRSLRQLPVATKPFTSVPC